MLTTLRLDDQRGCDVRQDMAQDDSRSTGPHTERGNHMPWVLGNRCRELIYTGDTFDAERAFRLGLVDRVFPKASLEAETMKIAKRMSRVALAALQWNKRAINNTVDTMGLRAALQYGVEACSLLDAAGTPEYSTFDEIRHSKGLGEAMKWRDAQFAPLE